METKYRPQKGSHLPILIKVAGITKGSILELGMGISSTLVLHWLCVDSKRMLVSCESEEKHYDAFGRFENKFHVLLLVKDWDKAKIDKRWSVVLVDHKPAERRIVEIERLANLADYIIVHDTEPRVNKHYRYDKIWDLFKYRYDYTRAMPHTTVLSNFKDLTELI